MLQQTRIRICHDSTGSHLLIITEERCKSVDVGFHKEERRVVVLVSILDFGADMLAKAAAQYSG